MVDVRQSLGSFLLQIAAHWRGKRAFSEEFSKIYRTNSLAGGGSSQLRTSLGETSILRASARPVIGEFQVAIGRGVLFHQRYQKLNQRVMTKITGGEEAGNRRLSGISQATAISIVHFMEFRGAGARCGANSHVRREDRCPVLS
jgi:hypothetical protein